MSEFSGLHILDIQIILIIQIIYLNTGNKFTEANQRAFLDREKLIVAKSLV